MQGRPSISMQWGAWGGVGMAIVYNLLPRIAQSGLGVLLPSGGLQALENVMNMTLKLPSQLVVSPFDWKRLITSASHVYAVGHPPKDFQNRIFCCTRPKCMMTEVCSYCSNCIPLPHVHQRLECNQTCTQIFFGICERKGPK